jgi:type I site-specific restriction endonuclease
MALSESDTRAKLLDPALHACGWTEDLIRREETAGAIVIEDGKPRKKAKGRVDYTLRVKVNPETQPVAVALIEAKAESLPPNYGLEQAKLYADYDIKAVNPHRKDTEDTRTPEELLEIIEAKGREVAEALASLRRK